MNGECRSWLQSGLKGVPRDLWGGGGRERSNLHSHTPKEGALATRDQRPSLSKTVASSLRPEQNRFGADKAEEGFAHPICSPSGYRGGN